MGLVSINRANGGCRLGVEHKGSSQKIGRNPEFESQQLPAFNLIISVSPQIIIISKVEGWGLPVVCKSGFSVLESEARPPRFD